MSIETSRLHLVKGGITNLERLNVNRDFSTSLGKTRVVSLESLNVNRDFSTSLGETRVVNLE